MQLWIPYFMAAGIMAFFSLGVPDVRSLDGVSYISQRKTTQVKLCLFVITAVLLTICAFKMVSAAAVDEYAYRNRFHRYEGLALLSALEKSEGELVNGLLTWIATVIFQSDQGIFIVFGSLTAILYSLTIVKYCKDYTFGIILLMVIGIINTTFNITQQGLACAVFVYFSRYIYEKKFIKFLLVVLVCFLIHKASIVLMLAYFLKPSRDGTAKIRPILLIASLIFAVAYKSVEIIATFFPMLQQYVDIVAQGHEGTILVTVLINCVPALIAILYTKNIRAGDHVTALAANMSIVHAGIYIACIFDRYIARLGMYTAPFCVIFLANSTDKFGSRESIRLYKVIAVVLYSIELFLRMRGYTYEFNFSL